jgi:alpha-amylase
VSPDNATNKAVKWKSSDTDALTVDSNGKVTFKKESFDAYVTATAADKSGVTAKMFFSINEATAEKINLTSSGGTSYFQTRPNGAFKVTAKLTRTSDGRSVFNNKVTWSLSSNASSYAKIESSTDLTCTIRGLKEIPKGQTVILTATAKDASGKVVCEVKQPIYVSGKPYISKIKITEGSISVGGSWGTTAQVEPGDADVKKVEWVTSDRTVVELTYPDSTDKRKVRFNGKKKGIAKITCRATDGSGVISNEVIMVCN